MSASQELCRAELSLCDSKLCGLELSSVVGYYMHGSEFSDSKKDREFFCLANRLSASQELCHAELVIFL
jgi:hypothetical protein